MCSKHIARSRQEGGERRPPRWAVPEQDAEARGDGEAEPQDGLKCEYLRYNKINWPRAAHLYLGTSTVYAFAKKFGLFVFLLAQLGNAAAAPVRLYGLQKADSTPHIKVRLHRGLKTIHISGTDMHRKIHPVGDSKVLLGHHSLRFNCRGLTANIKNPPRRPVLLASLKGQGGLLSLHRLGAREGHGGNLHIVSSPAADACDVVHETGMEDYLATLLPKEMNAAWPMEALKAQAVAARSYALHKMQSRQVARRAGYETYYHLESSETHQVSGHHGDRTYKTYRAAQSTRGEVLTSAGGTLIPVFFHAQCGGHTFAPQHVWQNRVPGNRAVACPFCRERNGRAWTTSMGVARFETFLAWLGRKDLASRDPRPHLSEGLGLIPQVPAAVQLKIALGDQVIAFKKALLRRYFGRQLFSSNYFQVEWRRGEKQSTILFRGQGRGHGVGLCQLGALELAERGWSYKKILAHYFPHFKVARIY